MRVFVVALKDDPLTKCVTVGENCTDAVLRYYREYAGEDRYEGEYEEAGSGNELAAQVMAELFDCTEVYDSDNALISTDLALDYIKQRLNGDGRISVLL